MYTISGSVSADYDLIDTWMLSKRYEEAIEVNKKEMAMYLLSCNSTIDALLSAIKKRGDERNEANIPLCLLSRSYDVAQATEIRRLSKIIEEAREIFRQVQGGFRFVDEDYLDQVEKGEAEEILLVEDDYDSTDLELEENLEEIEDDIWEWLNGDLNINEAQEFNAHNQGTEIREG